VSPWRRDRLHTRELRRESCLAIAVSLSSIVVVPALPCGEFKLVCTRHGFSMAPRPASQRRLVRSSDHHDVRDDTRARDCVVGCRARRVDIPTDACERAVTRTFTYRGGKSTSSYVGMIAQGPRGVHDDVTLSLEHSFVGS